MKEAVRSSNVDAMDYNEESQVMTIYYRGGGTYEYTGVKKQFTEDLKKAPSFGKLLHILKKQWNWQYKKIS